MVLAGHHQPLRVWVLCLYFMGLHLSDRQIAGELGLAVSDVQAITEQLRRLLISSTPAVELKGEVEPVARVSGGIDETYVVAWHKGQLGRHRKLAGAPGCGTPAKDKPPVLGLIQRGGDALLRMLANVQQTTIKPIAEAAVAQGTLVHADEDSIYACLPVWGYRLKTVCHGRGGYARNEDGEGFCEVHVNTMEGFWSPLRSWLRPRRGISHDKLPLHLGFFQYVRNARRRGKSLRGAVSAALVGSRTHHHPGTQQEPRPIPADALLQVHQIGSPALPQLWRDAPLSPPPPQSQPTFSPAPAAGLSISAAPRPCRPSWKPHNPMSKPVRTLHCPGWREK